jgi:putative transposase|tara:strand:+ start:75 stop:1292 length:1218 start_codon:yes stop_codon:yes gene_type:complete
MKSKISFDLIDELLKGYKSPEDITGSDGILKQLTKAILERALESELTHELGYEKSSRTGSGNGNSRNGSSSKTLKTDHGDIDLTIPRDRNSLFEPQIVKKGQRRFTGFDDKILSMYARGMTTRDISDHLKEIYGVDVSADLISSVTNDIIVEMKEWQNRSLDDIYPIVFFDAIRMNIRDSGRVIKKAVYLAIGVDLEGQKDVLGIWIDKNEGAKFWLSVFTELKNRGMNDVLIACVDGLKGLPEAIESVFPEAEVQLCIVHMVRNSLKFVSYKDRKQVASDLKEVYRAVTLDQAETALSDFASKWDSRYPLISKSWRSNWDHIIPFFAFPEDIRKAIYTTNAIESLNNSLRKVTKNRNSFPSDEAVIKLLYMALRNIMKKWTMPIRSWSLAVHQFSIHFEGRLPL